MQQSKNLIEPPVWRLEIEVGNSSAFQHPPEPKYSFRIETNEGTQVFECDFQTLCKLRKELDIAIQNFST